VSAPLATIERHADIGAPRTTATAPPRSRFMVHIAKQENDGSGSPVNWGERVSDARYGAAPATDGTA